MKNQLFFEIWKGTANRDFYGLNGKNILVIGASRYCPYVLDFKRSCEINCNLPILNNRGWNEISKKCPLVKVMKEKNPEYTLKDINTWSVSNTGRDGEEEENQRFKAYEVFSNILNIALKNEYDRKNGMSRVYFCNFLQTINAQKKHTPEYRSNIKLYKKSYKILESIISEVKPDGIIFWASQEAWKGFSDLCKCLRKTNKADLFKYVSGGKEIMLVKMRHPAQFYNFEGEWTEEAINKEDCNLSPKKTKPTIINNIRELYEVSPQTK